MTEDVVAREWSRQTPARIVPEGVASKPAWRPFVDPARIWLNADKLPYPRYDEDMKGSFIARRAGQYLEERRRDGRPFALWVSFMEPHSPYDFPVEDRSRYDPASFTPPRLGPEDLAQVPAVFNDLTEAEKRGIIAAYYTSVRFLDRNIGAVLKKLDDLGFDRNTFLVYTADHGYCLGQHGRFEKHIGYDPALRVPHRSREMAGRRGYRPVDLFSPPVVEVTGDSPRIAPVVHPESLKGTPVDHVVDARRAVLAEGAYVVTAPFPTPAGFQFGPVGTYVHPVWFPGDHVITEWNGADDRTR
jgi:arylsulfatase A-like enzyme